MTKEAITDQSEVKIENFKRELRVELKPDELAERADRAAHLLKARDDKEADVKAAAAAGKSQIKEFESEMRRIQGEVRDRATYKSVDCQRQYNYRLGVVREIRVDTGDLISERPMRAEERQRTLDLPEPERETNQADAESERDAFDPEPDAEPEPEPDLATAKKPKRWRKRRGATLQ